MYGRYGSGVCPWADAIEPWAKAIRRARPQAAYVPCTGPGSSALAEWKDYGHGVVGSAPSKGAKNPMTPTDGARSTADVLGTTEIPW